MQSDVLAVFKLAKRNKKTRRKYIGYKNTKAEKKKKKDKEIKAA